MNFEVKYRDLLENSSENYLRALSKVTKDDNLQSFSVKF
jgi:hypothetical protein